MKKLLLYLVAIITLGTMSVDALADKPIYVEWPNYGQSGQMTTLHFWYWNDNSNPKVAPDGDVYDYNGNNNKIKPNLFDTTNPATSFYATTVTGSDGKTYRKVMVPDNTSNIRFMANNNLEFTANIFDKVYVPSGNTVTQGSSVSEIFPSQGPDLTKNEFNIRINDSSWQGRKSSDAEGSYTYENLSLTTASVNIQVFDQQSTQVYYSISGNENITPGTALTTPLSSGSGNGNAITIQNFDSSSTYSIKLTYKGDGKVTILVTKNQGETPGTDYSSYKANYKAQGTGAGWEVLTENFNKNGIATFEVPLGTGEGFNVEIAHGSTTEYLAVNNNTNFELTDGITQTFTVTNSKTNDDNYIKVKNGTGNTYTVTINYPEKTILVSSGPVGDTYSWFPIVNGAKAEWTNSSNLRYTAASLNSFAVGLYKNNETTPTKTYGLNSTTVSASNNYTFNADETAVTVDNTDYKDFTFTVTPGTGTAPDIASVTVAVTSTHKDHFTWKPFVGKENPTEAEWTSVSNGTYTYTAESLDGFSIKLYNNGDEVATYGHTGNSMGATEANHTLHKGNKPVAINNTDYQDFTFTFTPGEITSIPDDIKVNLTSTNKGDVVTGRAIYLGGTEGFANVNGVDLKGGWSNYENDANKLTDNGDGTYSKEVSLVNEKEFAVFIDGKSYSPGSGTDRFWLNSYVIKWDLGERATNYSMLIKSDFPKAIVTVWFEDGKPKMSVTDPAAVPVTVYFVNRAGWEGTMRCMNWTDKDVPEKYNNGKEFPGDNMTKLGDSAEEDALKHQILGTNYSKWKDDIWKFTLSNKYNEDGTFYRPKLIFSTGGSIDVDQSRNLFLVANGIYTNSAGQNESDVKASELLPARIINDEGEVEVYPNTFHNTKYSTIYTSDPRFLKWAKDWTSSNAQRIGIQLTYEKDGETFTCTGNPGSTTMVKTVINGKEFLRLDIAEDVIPDQTRVKELIIWELSGFGAYGNITLKDDGSFVVEGSTLHKLGFDTDGKNGDHVTGSSDHHKCINSDCPLVFTNVYFRNGFVYNRDGIHSILEEVKPDALYIVSRGSGIGEDGVDHDFTLEGYPGTKLTINGVEKQAYRINAIELLGRPQYVIPDVPYQAYFSFVGLFNNYTDEDGNITTDKHILYAFPFTGDNTYTNDKALVPGKPEAISADDNGFYSIDRNGQDYDFYDVTVDWLTPAVSIAPAKQDAEFILSVPDADGNLHPQQNGFLYMYAMADNEFPVEEGTGKILYYKDENNTELNEPISEPSELRSRLCIVTYNEDIEDESFFNNVKVSMTRTNDYERYFRNNTKNKPALVRSKDAGYVREGNALLDHETLEGAAEVADKHKHIYLRAHTAGVAIVRITQDKAVTLGDLTFNPTEYAFPVRILPTPSSIGLELNGHGIYAINNKGGVDLDPMTGEAPEYEFGVTNDEYKDNKTPGQIWTRDCIKMEPNGCAYEVEDNDGQKIQTVKIYWDYEKPAEASKSRRSVVEAQSSALTAYDVYYPIAFTEEQRFSRTHAISETELKKNNNTVYMQIVHNGVVSPVYTVKVNAGDNVPTDVNEVEVAEEVEPVYYNLNGVRVNGENLAKGIYVKVTGNRTEKIYVK